VPDEFKTDYPKRRGYKTKEGHLLIFDDAQEQIIITNGFTDDTITLHKGGRIEVLSPTVQLASAPREALMKALTYNSAEGTMLGFLTAFVSLVGVAFTTMIADPHLTLSLLPATIAAMTAAGTPAATIAITGVTTFISSSNTWTSTKSSTG